jgi:hypothetical protein
LTTAVVGTSCSVGSESRVELRKKRPMTGEI